ncbi:MAG: universal stress protein [Deltaproteobacteria bacterium]|nr:universal stress protein [Deltaproteobacteria bacterium]
MTMRKIIVPLDGSKLAEQALPYVRLLAEATGATVELLCVTDSADQAPLARAADYCKDAEARSFPAGAKVDRVTLPGTPAEVIVDRAESDTESLIAMTTHGASGLRRWLLGSVALKVVQAATAPVLLVRADGAPDKVAIRSIIVALDGSELAESVIEPAVELAKHLNGELLLTVPLWEG